MSAHFFIAIVTSSRGSIKLDSRMLASFVTLRRMKVIARKTARQKLQGARKLQVSISRHPLHSFKRNAPRGLTAGNQAMTNHARAVLEKRGVPTMTLDRIKAEQALSEMHKSSHDIHPGVIPGSHIIAVTKVELTAPFAEAFNAIASTADLRFHGGINHMTVRTVALALAFVAEARTLLVGANKARMLDCNEKRLEDALHRLTQFGRHTGTEAQA